jgi:hypothetical protein
MEIKEIDDIATRNAKHGPNFLLIVLLFAASILIILVIGYFTFDYYEKHIVTKAAQVIYPVLRSQVFALSSVPSAN